MLLLVKMMFSMAGYLMEAWWIVVVAREQRQCFVFWNLKPKAFTFLSPGSALKKVEPHGGECY